MAGEGGEADARPYDGHFQACARRRETGLAFPSLSIHTVVFIYFLIFIFAWE